MNGNSSNSNGPGRLADLVAELLKRFRHFSGEAEVAPGLASHLARIKVSARLLTSAGLPTESAREDFARLTGVLTELVARYESVPESLPHHLGPPVARLADYLEEIMLRLDGGVPLSEAAGDAGWATIQASFSNAGTPLAVLEDADDLLRKWGNRWSADGLTPIQVKNLGRRWQELKSKGDRLFCSGEIREPGVHGFSGDRAASPVVFLLLDSTFRRDQLREKLIGCGYGVTVPTDPGQALKLLETGPAPEAVLCDNLEPTRHLVRFLCELSNSRAERIPPCVLVVSTSLGPESDDDRARGLGAVASWTDPFDLEDLRRILQRLSQP
jgi:CheY-like chemotaxis protein